MSKSIEKTLGPTVWGRIADNGLEGLVDTRFCVYEEYDSVLSELSDEDLENLAGLTSDNGGDILYAVAPNLLAPKIALSTGVFRDGVIVALELHLDTSQAPRYDVITCRISTALNRPISMAEINKIPLDAIAHANLPLLYGYVGDELIGVVDWEYIAAAVPFDKLRSGRSLDDVLPWVLRVYAAASIAGKPPAKTVSEEFGVPLRTASYWIRAAKNRFEFDLRSDAREIPIDDNAGLPPDAAKVRVASDRFLNATISRGE